MKKHLTPGNILFAVLFILLIIPSTRVFIQSRILRLVLFSPDPIESGPNLNGRQVLLYNMDDRPVNLEFGTGKPVVVNLWATWCGPCVAEMPSLHRLYEAYEGKVDFALISSEETEAIQKFVKSNEFKFPIYHLGEHLPAELESNTIPATFIIGSDGRIIMSEKGAKDWNSDVVHEILDKELEKS